MFIGGKSGLLTALALLASIWLGISVTGCAGEEKVEVRAASKSLPAGDEPRLAATRARMVSEQIRARGIRQESVLAAMAKVPRHRFVPPSVRAYSYEDGPLPIGAGQTISQPFIVAFMTEALQLGGEEKVLEIGTGSGYQAAILAEVAGQVYSIEIIDSLARQARDLLQDLGYDNLHLRSGDGYRGWPEAAPFDAIIVTAAPPAVPQPLLDQLKVGGRMIIPVGDSRQELVLIEKTESGIIRREVLPVRFVPMTGEVRK